MILQLPLPQLLALLSDVIECTADQSLTVNAIRSLESAQPLDLALIFERGDASVFDAVALDAIKASNAGVVLSSFAIPGKACIVVHDVLAAYHTLISYAAAKRITSVASIASTAVVHPTAVIEEGAWIGARTTVGAHASIGKRCVLGDGVIIHPGARILDDCTVGDSSIIHANAVIGSDGFGYQVTKTGMRKIAHIGNVRIGKHVEIGAGCTIDRAMFESTIIGDGVKMDNVVHVAHNVQIGASTAILAQTAIGGSVVIGMGCMIGGQVALKDHVKIGNGVKIVSKSAVMYDVVDGQTVCGIPAIPFAQWKRITVCLQKLPELIKQARDKSSGGWASRLKAWIKS